MTTKAKKHVGVEINNNGVNFRVWAPFASNVSITGAFNNWSRTQLNNEMDGHWSVTIKDALEGQEYKYVIENGENTYFRNDPRALFFPTSTGNSVIAGNDFDWGVDNFSALPTEEQVIYELHIGTFNRPDPATNGNFASAIEKLDYLKDLGINMIEVMPISTMSMDRGWGYATDYIYAVESLYGGRQGFMEFVKAAHEHGIGIILDVVYNHFGPDQNMDLWQFDGWSENNMGGIYFYNDWRADTPWGSNRPDYGRVEVRQYILDNVANWLVDCHVDGLRVDSTIFIRNVKGYNNDPGNDLAEGWQLMQEINNIARKIKPNVITIAEDVADNEYIVKPTDQGGAGFAAQWELGFPRVLKDALHSNDPFQINLSGVIAELTRRYNDNYFSRINFVDSHDSSSNGSARFIEEIAPGKSNELFARQQALLAAALLLTAPGIPMLFQGQEFLEVGSFNDWQALDWDKLDQFGGIKTAYKDLIDLRKNSKNNTAGLTGQSINLIHVDDNNKVIAYQRWRNGGPKDDVLVIINFSKNNFKEYMLGFPRNGEWKVRFNSHFEGYNSDIKKVEINSVFVDNGNGLVTLPPQTALILSQDN